MFFLPQTQRLLVDVARKGSQLRFADAQLTVLFVYSRPECRAMNWTVRSAHIVQTGAYIEQHWWAIDSNARVKDDLPKDDSSSTYHAPVLTFLGRKFSDALAAGKECKDQVLYDAIISNARVQLDVRVNNEFVVPLLVTLDYRLTHL